jgi:polar amino acid transport system substrate-binding protein
VIFRDYATGEKPVRKPFLASLFFFIYCVPLFAIGNKIAVAAFEYPPIYQDSPEKGLSGDLVVAAFKAVGIDVELRFFPVNRMVQVVSSGEAVCGIGGAILFSDPAVAGTVTIAAPVQYVVQTFLYDSRKFPQGIKWTNLAELSKYRIGVLGGSGIARFLEKTRELSLESNNVHDGSAKQLQAGRVDLWAIVDLTGVMYMKRLFPAEAAQYRFTSAYNRGDVSVIFSKKADPDGTYLAKFRKGLAAIKKDGTYMDLMEKYYGGKSAINRDSLTDDMR